MGIAASPLSGVQIVSVNSSLRFPFHVMLARIDLQIHGEDAETSKWRMWSGFSDVLLGDGVFRWGAFISSLTESRSLPGRDFRGFLLLWVWIVPAIRLRLERHRSVLRSSPI